MSDSINITCFYVVIMAGLAGLAN